VTIVHLNLQLTTLWTKKRHMKHVSEPL